MANLIPEEGTRFSNPDNLQSQVREYLLLKESMSNMETRSKELREKIFAHIDNEGEEESNGSISLYLEENIGDYQRVQKTRRAKRNLNETLAEEILETTGLADEVFEMKRVINEDALMGAYYEGKLTEEQLDEMFPTTVIWALTTLKK
jgi:hypothetical protein